VVLLWLAHFSLRDSNLLFGNCLQLLLVELRLQLDSLDLGLMHQVVNFIHWSKEEAHNYEEQVDEPTLVNELQHLILRRHEQEGEEEARDEGQQETGEPSYGEVFLRLAVLESRVDEDKVIQVVVLVG